MRHQSVPAEQKLWFFLRDRKLGGFKFRRQVPIDRYVADFYCAECRLVVEADGDSHFEPGSETRDAERTQYLCQKGYGVIRYTNVEVFESFDGVLESLLEPCERRRGVTVGRRGVTVGPSPLPSPPSTGERE